MLDEAELEKLLPWLEPFELELGSIVYHPHVHIEHVYFPTSGSISTIVVADDGELEVSSVGKEGFAGVASLLHASSVPTRAVVQEKGSAYRVEVEVFRAVVAESLQMQQLFCRYTLATLNQLSQAAACNRLHSLEARCARWLLMAHDRTDGDQLNLTHEMVSQMLGVTRPGVTIAAGALQKLGLIQYSRGKLNIVDRAGLEQAACECYGIVAAYYDAELN
jgi:CRP-like cAMP-binding protein